MMFFTLVFYLELFPLHATLPPPCPPSCIKLATLPIRPGQRSEQDPPDYDEVGYEHDLIPRSVSGSSLREEYDNTSFLNDEVDEEGVERTIAPEGTIPPEGTMFHEGPIALEGTMALQENEETEVCMRWFSTLSTESGFFMLCINNHTFQFRCDLDSKNLNLQMTYTVDWYLLGHDTLQDSLST